jgi:hypothetical protein
VLNDGRRSGHDRDVAPELRLLEEEPLDDVAPVAQADHKLGVPVPGIVLHDVAQQRATADLHHRLRS